MCYPDDPDEMGTPVRVHAWNCPVTESLPIPACCTPCLTAAMREAATNQLSGLRLFPTYSGEEAVVCLELQLPNTDLVMLGCLNRLTPESGYHILHLLHHLNGRAVTDFMLYDRLSLARDPLTGASLEQSIFSTLASVYSNSGIPTLPRAFTLYVDALGHTPPPSTQILIHPSPIVGIHFRALRFRCKRDRLLDWLESSLCSDRSRGPEINLLDACLLSRHCQTISLSIWGHIRWEEVDRITKVS